MDVKTRTAGLEERSLYVIRCEGDYDYIGESKTQWLETYRIPQQFGEKVGRGPQSQFCKIHKPIEVVEIIHLGMKEYYEAEILENALTKIYATRYPGKVEGGIACLSENKKQSLQANTIDEILNSSKIE